eukprot:7839621-Pyramimonas_sp.AAC.1
MSRANNLYSRVQFAQADRVPLAWHVPRCVPVARPLARRLVRPSGRSAVRPPGMFSCRSALGQLLCAQAARAYDPDQFGQDSDAKEDSIQNAIGRNLGIAHRNSA